MSAQANTPATPVPSLLGANLICMASMLIWAAGLPAADFIIPLLPADQLSALRMALAALALLPVWALIEGPGAFRRANWLKGIAVGSLIGLGAWFLIQGQARSGAVTAAMISTTLPMVGIALEVVLDGRKLSVALVLGLLLSLAGGMMALDFKAGGMSMGFGALLCFCSVLSFTLGSRLTVTAFPGLSPIGRTALTISGAAIAVSTVAALGIAFGAPPPDFSAWGWKETLALLAFSVGSLGISQLMWIMSVEKLGIGLSGLHINAAPFYVMIILFLLGGRWDWGQAAAACLVAVGVLIAQGIIPLGKRA
ncbi:DMT family transporter [Cypionkella sp.]|jgi:drug/metabolite transporter (DMT)-like permease|uniref:DMT family transporter n=1 Tax=Cypionkella sp. TaxID=2811411 RepID=UPI00271F53A2|nr:DMT family transporter [Cypionkella sp.]MDO8985592.1 DMT family transporter [Cypionkella sp.]MDP2048742.1 DMT family transporter [Cypionkella sp.]